MRGWLTVLAFAGLVALIGAAVGLATSDLRAEGGLAGALIGAIIGSWLGLRMQAHSAAISRARQDPQEALRQQALQAEHSKIKSLPQRDRTRQKLDDLSALH